MAQQRIICPIDEFDEYVVALYCVQECPDTVLSVGNLRDPFAELSEEQKKLLEKFRKHSTIPRGRYTIEWDKDDPNDLPQCMVWKVILHIL